MGPPHTADLTNGSSADLVSSAEPSPQLAVHGRTGCNPNKRWRAREMKTTTDGAQVHLRKSWFNKVQLLDKSTGVAGCCERPHGSVELWKDERRCM